jgi:hypothetical protein
MVLTGSFVLSPVTGLVCHRCLADIGVSRPTGPTSPSTRLERQRRGVRTTRLRRPQARALVRSAARVHRIPSRVRDDRDTPLMRDETAGDLKVIWISGEAEYFCKGGWTLMDTDIAKQPVGQISKQLAAR